MSMEFLVKFFGLLLGILARTLLPWLRKVKEGKIRGFGRRYIFSALASAAIGLFLTLTIFPQFEAGAAGQGFEELFKLFCLAFGFGYGSNALVNEGGAWVAKSGGIEPLGGDEGQTPAR
jgi:predicted Kef-type K+ transport protein